MANVKNIKRRRFKRTSIDDLFYSDEERSRELRNKQEYRYRCMLKPDTLFSKNDYLFADVSVGGKLGRIYRNGLDDRGRYCVYSHTKKNDYFVTYPSHITIIQYYK